MSNKIITSDHLDITSNKVKDWTLNLISETTDTITGAIEEIYEKIDNVDDSKIFKARGRLINYSNNLDDTTLPPGMYWVAAVDGIQNMPPGKAAGHINIYVSDIADNKRIDQQVFDVSGGYIWHRVYHYGANGTWSSWSTDVESDSGWNPLPLEAGISPSNNMGTRPIPSYRKVGNHVYIEGGVAIEGYSGSTVKIATLPAGFRPLSNTYVLNACSGANIARVYVQPNGNMAVEWIKKISDGSDRTGDMSWLQINLDFFVTT